MTSCECGLISEHLTVAHHSLQPLKLETRSIYKCVPSVRHQKESRYAKPTSPPCSRTFLHFGWLTSAILLSSHGMEVRRFSKLLFRDQESNHLVLDRRPGKALACHVWSLPVSLHLFPHVSNSTPRCAVGRSSRLLTMNGGSFEVVAPTCGPYGSVVISAFTLICSHALG